MKPQQSIDLAESERGLSLIAGGVFEVRALEVQQGYRPSTMSGFFDSPALAASAIAKLPMCRGVYVTLNPVNPDLLGRRMSKLARSEQGALTGDADIICRRWLPIDVDSIRTKHVAATDAEHAAALVAVNTVRDTLSEEGWPTPITLDSGNGYGLLYRVDVPSEDGGLIQRVIDAIADRFSTERAEVDRSVFNASRIWRIPGTWNRKGDGDAATIGRSHRRAKIVYAPESLEVVSMELLLKIGGDGVQSNADHNEPDGDDSRGGAKSFDLPKWIAKHKLDVGEPVAWQSKRGPGKKWVFGVCPWNPDHTDRSAFIAQDGKGAISAGCRHNGCRANDWHALRDRLEPNWRERKSKSKAPGAATSLANMVKKSGAVLFHNAEGVCYAECRVSDHFETMPIRGRDFRLWLSGMFYRACRKAAGGQAIADAVGLLEGIARFEGSEQPVYVRVAGNDERIYLDMCDKKWRAIEIDAAGWRIIDHSPVRFRRARGMLPLFEPVRGGSLDELRGIVNLADDADWALTAAFMVGCLRPDGPYPVLVVNGEQGAAKTSLCRVIRSVIDPNVCGLRTMPREARDLAIAANNSWTVVFDNVSDVRAWLSDYLCRLATGGGFGTRELYSDDAEKLFDSKRPVVLNGIDDFVTRGDLADRAIALRLPSIPPHKRRTEAEISSALDRVGGRVLAGLLDATVCAIQGLPDVELKSLPRMADFAKWATAAESGIGICAGDFMRAYSANRAAAVCGTIEASAIGSPLLAMTEAVGDWTGSPAGLLEALEPYLAQYELASGKTAPRFPEKWPKSATACGNAVRRLADDLRRVGVDVTAGRGHGGRWVRVRKIPVPSDTGDAASRNGVFGAENGDFDDSERVTCEAGSDTSARQVTRGNGVSGGENAVRVARVARDASEPRFPTGDDAGAAYDLDMDTPNSDADGNGRRAGTTDRLGDVAFGRGRI